MKPFRSISWLAALPGVVLIALGCAAVFWPQTVIQILPVLIGALILALGVFWLADGIYGRRAVNPLGVPRMLQGAFSILVGCVFLFNRSVSVAFLGVVLGLWALCSGIYSLRKAFLRRSSTPYFAFSCLDGAVKAAIGLFMVLRPFGSMAVWAAATGVLCVFSGVSVLVSAFYLYRFFND